MTAASGVELAGVGWRRSLSRVISLRGTSIQAPAGTSAARRRIQAWIAAIDDNSTSGRGAIPGAAQTVYVRLDNPGNHHLSGKPQHAGGRTDVGRDLGRVPTARIRWPSIANASASVLCTSAVMTLAAKITVALAREPGMVAVVPSRPGTAPTQIPRLRRLASSPR